MTFEDAVWIGLGLKVDSDGVRVPEPGEIRETVRPCTAGDQCVRQDQPIIVWTDADGRIVKSVPTALVFDHNGIRHHACPDLQFRAWLVEKGLTQ